MSTSEEAMAWVKKHSKQLIEAFASSDHFPRETEPLTIFMAGSPGAGKTETACSMVKNSNVRLVHIDADAIRSKIPGFIGANASLFQSAATIGVEKLYDHILKHRQSAIVDTTFTPYEKVYKNVERSIKKGRPVLIVYVYQEPVLAWNFTKARERVEGRNVPRTSFIRQFLEAPVCVQRIHDEFPNQVKIAIVRKDVLAHGMQEYHEYVQKIDKNIYRKYSRDDLERLIM